MMTWCSSAALRLAVVLSLSLRSFTEQKLLCSSDSLSVWWEYQGPVVFISTDISSCTLGQKFNLTFTAMPMFTVVQVGFHLKGLYKNETWLSFDQPLGPCEDFKSCDVIKGETFHESLQFILKPYFTPDGEYQFILTVNIIDDFDRELNVTVKSTVYMRNKI